MWSWWSLCGSYATQKYNLFVRIGNTTVSILYVWTKLKLNRSGWKKPLAQNAKPNRYWIIWRTVILCTVKLVTYLNINLNIHSLWAKMQFNWSANSILRGLVCSIGGRTADADTIHFANGAISPNSWTNLVVVWFYAYRFGNGIETTVCWVCVCGKHKTFIGQ